MALMLEQDDLQLEEALAFLDTLECSGPTDAAKMPFLTPSSPPLMSSIPTSKCVSPCSSDISDWGTTSGNTSDGSSCGEVSSSSRSSSTTQQVSRRNPKTVKKTTKNSTKATTPKPPKVRKRKHNKTEILALREEVLHLTARLAQRRKLLSSTSVASSAAQPNSSGNAEKDSNSLIVATDKSVDGVQLADCELHKLELSKTLNRRLKAALDKQMKLSSTLQKVFEKQSAMKEELESMKFPEPANQTHADLVEAHPLDLVVDVTTSLQYYTDQFYSTIDEVIALINSRNTKYVFSSSHTYQDPVRGKIVELISNAPLATPLYEVERCLWRHFSTMIFKMTQHGSAVKHKQANSFERRYSTNLNGNFGEFPVRVTSQTRKFEEPRRTVILHSSHLDVEGTGITLREIGCVVLTNPLSEGIEFFAPPSSTTQFQTFYRLFAETVPVGVDAASKAQIKALLEFIFHAETEKMYGNILKMQDGLVNQFPTVQAEVDLFGVSPLIECNT
ncbi:hypothetical protein FI667_g11719, partial [Globisporangium splendens]